MDHVGTHFPFPPQPPIPESTRYVDAGCLKIGVEHRFLDNDGLQATYEGTEFEDIFKGQEIVMVDHVLDGVSLHVTDADTGHEYLRFDCFENHPHYHYLHPWTSSDEVDNHVVNWDYVAHGSMTPWALEWIRTRLPEMLTEAGGGDLVSRLNQAEIDRAADEVERLMKQLALSGSAAG